MSNNLLYDVTVQYFCLLFALCVHEAAHALTADWRGDPSPRLMGRVTLNPLAHIDPIGTVVLPLLMMFFGGLLFGWAKPVQFNPLNLKDMRRDPVWIALAGPLSNLLLAVLGAVALRVAVTVAGIGVLGTPLAHVLIFMVIINVVLLLFNLIPVPPLDGHYVLHYFLPPKGQQVLERIGPFGILIAIIVVVRLPLFQDSLDFLSNGLLALAIWPHQLG